MVSRASVPKASLVYGALIVHRGFILSHSRLATRLSDFSTHHRSLSRQQLAEILFVVDIE
jgi:hypothetical protein